MQATFSEYMFQESHLPNSRLTHQLPFHFSSLKHLPLLALLGQEILIIFRNNHTSQPSNHFLKNDVNVQNVLRFRTVYTHPGLHTIMILHVFLKMLLIFEKEDFAIAILLLTSYSHLASSVKMLPRYI